MLFAWIPTYFALQTAAPLSKVRYFPKLVQHPFPLALATGIFHTYFYIHNQHTPYLINAGYKRSRYFTSPGVPPFRAACCHHPPPSPRRNIVLRPFTTSMVSPKTTTADHQHPSCHPKSYCCSNYRRAMFPLWLNFFPPSLPREPLTCTLAITITICTVSCTSYGRPCSAPRVAPSRCSITVFIPNSIYDHLWLARGFFSPTNRPLCSARHDPFIL